MEKECAESVVLNAFSISLGTLLITLICFFEIQDDSVVGLNGSVTLIDCDFFLYAAAIVGKIERVIRDEDMVVLAISLANIVLKLGAVFLNFGFTDLKRFFVTFLIGASYIFSPSD